MATASAQSTRDAVRAIDYAQKDYVAIGAVGSSVPRFTETLDDIRRRHGRDGVRAKHEVDADGKTVRDDEGRPVDARDAGGDVIYESKYVQAWCVVESFGRDELDPDDPDSWQRANQLGKALARDRAPGHPSLVVTEVNGRSGCVHNHIIVGATHAETGKQLDSNVFSSARLAVAHDRVLGEQGFAQREDLSRVAETARAEMEAAAEAVRADPDNAGLSPSQLSRKVTSAENRVRLQPAVARDASLEREQRRQREHERYMLGQADRRTIAGLDVSGMEGPPERFSEIELEARAREAMADPRAASWEGLGEVAREYKVTIDRRGQDVTYGMMMREADGSLAEPSRAHRRRGRSLGEGFRREDVERAIEHNAGLAAEAAPPDLLQQEQREQEQREAERAERARREAELEAQLEQWRDGRLRFADLDPEAQRNEASVRAAGQVPEATWARLSDGEIGRRVDAEHTELLEAERERTQPEVAEDVAEDAHRDRGAPAAGDTVEAGDGARATPRSPRAKRGVWVSGDARRPEGNLLSSVAGDRDRAGLDDHEHELLVQVGGRGDDRVAVIAELAADDPAARGRDGLLLKQPQTMEMSDSRGGSRTVEKTWTQYSSQQLDQLEAAAGDNRVEANGRSVLALRGRVRTPSADPHSFVIDTSSAGPSDRRIGPDVLERQQDHEERVVAQKAAAAKGRKENELENEGTDASDRADDAFKRAREQEQEGIGLA